MDKKSAEKLAKAIAVTCVRNGYIEELHGRKGARTQEGDYSDVKVITPDREIPWNEVSRFSDEEIKHLMKEVVNKLYTIFLNFDDEDFVNSLLKLGGAYSKDWDKPEEVADFVLRNRKLDKT
jgi:hypothetical protein